MRLIKYFLLLVMFSNMVNAEDVTVVAVGKATLDRAVIHQNKSQLGSGFSANELKKLEEFETILSGDFAFYRKKFVFTNQKEISRNFEANLDYIFYGQKNIRYVLQAKLLKIAGKSTATVEAYDVQKKTKIYGETADIDFSNIRRFAHKITDEIYQKIEGKRSIFTSQIVFVSDLGSTRQKIMKELYIMDFDGRNMKRLTHHHGFVISPTVSSDKKKVIYSLIKDGARRNIDLYQLDLTTLQSSAISSLNGINSGASFLPDEDSIALTLSHVGNAEIFVMNLKNKELRRLTRNDAPDVDPSFSKDGKLMTFLSGRPGKAMIYTMDPSGEEKDVKRISFVGDYNASPRFDPEGKEIAFASWIDRSFDIFRIDRSGNNLVRLTKNFGSNEDPTWSPDSEFIAFSSQKVLSRTEAEQNIYIMDKDGEIIHRPTGNFGKCLTPRWTNY